MSIRFQTELQKLKAAGIELADLEPVEIEALVRACDRCDNPFSAANAEAAGFPVRVADGVTLWRLTAGACIWLDEYARRWWGEDSEHYKWAVFFALRHARERETFHRLTDEGDAYRAIREDILTLTCTEAEIMAALCEYGDQDDDGRERPATMQQADWRTLVQRLEVGTGVDADTWMWERAARYIAEAGKRLGEFAAAQGGDKAKRAFDELDRAVRGLARVTAGIRARIKALRTAKEGE